MEGERISLNAFSLQLKKAHVLVCPITGNVEFDHLVKVVLGSFL